MTEDSRLSMVYRYLQEKAMLLLLVFDSEGRVLEANQFARALIGADLIGRPLNQVFVDFEDNLDINQMADEEQYAQRLNISVKNTIPQTFYFDFFRENDRILALGQSDHGELEMMQRNLVEINTQLSNTTRMLQKANAELARLNELKNQFLGMAAHDMRSPIGQIMACSDLLLLDLKETLDPGELDFLEIIQSSSQFLLRLIDEFLDLSIIESGHLRLELRTTDLEALIRKNIRLNRLLAEKEKINLSYEYEESLPAVIVDPGKIEQVLNNLISNAMKFSEPYTPIEVRLFRANDEIVVSVKDQGPGIPQTEITWIFAPYATAREKSFRGIKGVGLGLAIAQKIIQSHRGRIWVESELGRGSTFFFTLPLSQKTS